MPPKRKAGAGAAGAAKRIKLAPPKPHSKIYTAEEVAAGRGSSSTKWYDVKPGTVMELLQVRDQFVQELTDELINYEGESVIMEQAIENMQCKLQAQEDEIKATQEEIAAMQRAILHTQEPPKDGLPALYYTDDGIIRREWQAVCGLVMRFCQKYCAGKTVDYENILKEVDRGRTEWEIFVGAFREVSGGRPNDLLPLLSGSGSELVAAAIIMMTIKDTLFDSLHKMFMLDPLNHPWEDTEHRNTDEGLNLIAEHERVSCGRNDVAFEFNSLRAKLFSYLILHRTDFMDSFMAYTDMVGVLILNAIAPFIKLNQEWLGDPWERRNNSKRRKAVFEFFEDEASLDEFLDILSRVLALALRSRLDWTIIYWEDDGLGKEWNRDKFTNIVRLGDLLDRKNDGTIPEVVPSYMEDPKQDQVDLVVFPALLRRGDRYGERYEPRVLVGAQVVIIDHKKRIPGLIKDMPGPSRSQTPEPPAPQPPSGETQNTLPIINIFSKIPKLMKRKKHTRRKGVKEAAEEGEPFDGLFP